MTEFPNEDVLPDDYPVYGDYFYVADGNLYLSDWHDVTVRELKIREKFKEVRRCNISARRAALQSAQESSKCAMLHNPPMADRIRHFWNAISEPHVRILVDMRCDHEDGSVHWDSYSFGDDVAKALVGSRAHAPETQPSPAASINQDLLQTCKKAAEWLSGWSSAVPYLDDLMDAIKAAERVDPAFQEALHDMRTHQDAWRNAIQHMLHASTGDEEYWRHELKAFNRTAYALAQELPPSTAMTEPADDWQNDPSADERWSAGLDYGQEQLCKFLGVDPGDVTWDAATETLDGDVQAVIGNILRVKFGEDWSPRSDARTADAWQDISTAPKDGVSICAWNGEFTVMRWIEGDGYALWVYSDELLRDADPDAVQPTHWMPQPDGPAQLRMTVEGSDHD